MDFPPGNDSLERGAELGNVPLSVAELIELPADRILWRDCECVAKGTVREADGEIGIEHEEALADRLHEIPRVNFAHGTAPAHLLMTGLILDSKNTILPEDPAISPAGLPIVPQLGCAVGNVHYRFGGELTFYVYVLGR